MEDNTSPNMSDLMNELENAAVQLGEALVRGWDTTVVVTRVAMARNAIHVAYVEALSIASRLHVEKLSRDLEEKSS